MPRPQRVRTVCCEPEYECFRPAGLGLYEEIFLTVDEYETIRLVDYQGKTHQQAAEQMNISRTTVTEVYESARHKISDSLVNGKSLIISGGNYRVCNRIGRQCSKCGCSVREKLENYDGEMPRKGNSIMRIAVTYDNGNVFQHFGRTEEFKIFDVEGQKIVDSKVVGTNGAGHGAIAGFLSENQVDVLICGGIGGGAQSAIGQAGIKLYGGVSGNADRAVADFLEGNLKYQEDVHCDHHDHEHGDEGHSCGNHGCGKHDCHK